MITLLDFRRISGRSYRLVGALASPPQSYTAEIQQRRHVPLKPTPPGASWVDLGTGPRLEASCAVEIPFLPPWEDGLPLDRFFEELLQGLGRHEDRSLAEIAASDAITPDEAETLICTGPLALEGAAALLQNPALPLLLVEAPRLVGLMPRLRKTVDDLERVGGPAGLRWLLADAALRVLARSKFQSTEADLGFEPGMDDEREEARP